MSIYDPMSTTYYDTLSNTELDLENQPVVSSITYPLVDSTHRRSAVQTSISKTIPLPYWSCHTHNKTGKARLTTKYFAVNTYREVFIQPIAYSAYVYENTFSRFPEAIPHLDNKLLERLGSSKMELGVELAEMRQTANFIREKTVYLLLNVLDVRRGKIPRAIREQRIKRIWRSKRRDRASRMLLEYRYALGPLMGSIGDATKVLTEGLSQPSASFPFSSVKAKKMWKQGTSVAALRGLYFDVITEHTGRKLTAHAKVLYHWSDLDLAEMQQLGLSVGDVPQIIWELIPFSFVADWAVGVSAFLGRMAATQGLSFGHGYYAGKVEITSVSRAVPVDNSFISASAVTNATTTLEYTTRRMMTNWPLNTLTYENPLNLYNVATLAALLHQLSKGKKGGSSTRL